MHLYKSIKSFLFDKDYFIDIWSNNIHVFGFIDILTLNEEVISLAFENFKITIDGKEFRVLKLTKNEILVSGKFYNMKVIV